MVGMTDYSHQTIDDMLVDLKEWNKSIKETLARFEKNIQELKVSGYWNNADYDFKNSCYFLMKFFHTATQDIEEVINGINNEVKSYHIKIVENLAKVAHENYEHHRKIWREVEVKDYSNKDFRKFEDLYKEGSDMTGDMFDLSNLAKRLSDFEGRAINKSTQSTVVNNFNAPINAVQQNYDSNNINQNLGNSDGKTEELKQINDFLIQLKEMLNKIEFEEKEDIIENINDLEETLQSETPKKNRVKSFGGSIVKGIKNAITMKTFNNVSEVSSKLPQMIDDFSNVIDKF